MPARRPCRCANGVHSNQEMAWVVRVSTGPEFPVLWSNRHRSFNSARGNKAFWPNDHLKRDAAANTLIFYGDSGIWWRLLHNTGHLRNVVAAVGVVFVRHRDIRTRERGDHSITLGP